MPPIDANLYATVCLPSNQPNSERRGRYDTPVRGCQYLGRLNENAPGSLSKQLKCINLKDVIERQLPS